MDPNPAHERRPPPSAALLARAADTAMPAETLARLALMGVDAIDVVLAANPITPGDTLRALLAQLEALTY